MPDSLDLPHPIILAPSLLAADHACLIDGLKTAEDAGAHWIHLDIMDGHFVPNLSFGPGTVAALRPHSKKYFDVHLMVTHPQNYFQAFIDAGADQVTVHVEAECDKISGLLQAISRQNKEVGIALNPDTPAESILPFLDKVDLVLPMTVQPGFGGQAFRKDVLGKIEQLHTWRKQNAYRYRIEVDGGIDAETAEEAIAMGADTLVAGTSFFKDKGDSLKKYLPPS